MPDTSKAPHTAEARGVAEFTRVCASRAASLLLPSVLSAILLVLAFPRYDVEWLGWVGLAPLLVAMAGKRGRYCFLAAFVWSVTFFTGVFSWVFEIPGYTVLHHSLLALYLGPLLGLFGLGFSRIWKRWGATCAFLSAPLVWVSLEYVRSNLSFLSLPWNLLAHSQYEVPTIIQIASLTGAYGLSFLMVLVNAAVAAGALTLLCHLGWQKCGDCDQLSGRGLIFLTLAAVTLVVAAIAYGRVAIAQPNERGQIKLSVLQGNIDADRKRDPRKHAASIMTTHVELTRQASAGRPALLIWPEAATPGLILKDSRLMREMVETVREADTYFLVGSSEYAKFAKVDPATRRTGNTALFLSPEGKVLGQYLKIHLVPFGECVPYEGVIPWPGFIVRKDKQNWELAGQEFTLFELPKTKFGVVICWEIVFPDLFRQFVRDGADFMLNITNEGWFGATAAPYQLMAVSVFRSVENRVSMARAANTGISCFIDPFGRITGRVRNEGRDIFVKGYLTQEVPIAPGKTFYTHFGDFFAYLNLAGCGVIGLALLSGRRCPVKKPSFREEASP